MTAHKDIPKEIEAEKDTTGLPEKDTTGLQRDHIPIRWDEEQETAVDYDPARRTASVRLLKDGSNDLTRVVIASTIRDEGVSFTLVGQAADGRTVADLSISEDVICGGPAAVEEAVKQKALGAAREAEFLLSRAVILSRIAEMEIEMDWPHILTSSNGSDG